MSMQAFVAIAEIVSALSVAATLGLMVVSLRQNTNAQRAVAVDSLAAAIATINVPAIGSPVVGSAVCSATTDWWQATRDERIVAHYFLFSYFKLSENGWYQQRAKILEREQWLGWEKNLRKLYHSSGVQDAWWPNRRNAFSQQFQDYLSNTTSPGDIGSLSDVFGPVDKAAGR